MEPIIYPNVIIGEGAEIDKFVIIGQPPRGKKPGEIQTIIGSNAVIRSHTVIYAGNKIGDNFQTGHHVMIREDNVIGNNVSVGTGTVIEHHVKINDGARIHSNAFIPEYSVLEQECWIGPGAILTNARYPRSAEVKEKLIGPTIGKNAKIGAGVVLLPGIIVGANALVGAGSVVVTDVPADAVVVGNPARIIKFVREIESYR
jgi:acetyltransferase-like isoleucine patch superfamily enzyme